MAKKKPENFFQKKYGVLSGSLSAFVPGLGQAYNEEYLKGALVLGATIGSVFLLADGTDEAFYGDSSKRATSMIIWGLVIGTGTYIFGIVDAITSSARINKERGFALRLEPAVQRLFISNDGNYFGPKLTLTF